MDAEDSIVVVTDTSVLVNFLRIDRMDLIASHSSRFVITDHVATEITDYYPEQQERLDRALAAGVIEQLSVSGEIELGLYGALSATGRLGPGESAAIAYAIANDHALAIDDRAAVNQARRLKPDLVVLGTQEIMVHLIRDGAIALDEADQIKDTWATEHRFRLTITSFRDVL
jgi:hypothetical protein